MLINKNFLILEIRRNIVILYTNNSVATVIFNYVPISDLIAFPASDVPVCYFANFKTILNS